MTRAFGPDGGGELAGMRQPEERWLPRCCRLHAFAGRLPHVKQPDGARRGAKELRAGELVRESLPVIITRPACRSLPTSRDVHGGRSLRKETGVYRNDGDLSPAWTSLDRMRPPAAQSIERVSITPSVLF